MEKIDIERQVAQVVEDLFNQKEEADIRKQTEVELQKAASAISDLTTALEDKNEEVAGHEQKLSDSEARVIELTSELEAVKSELETANTEIVETKNEVDIMRKDRAAELRMVELEGASVVNSNRKIQMEKVREMSDDDFASYKEELESVRASVIAELEAAREEADKQSASEAAVAKAKAEDSKLAVDDKTGTDEVSEEASEENKEDSTVPAQIDTSNTSMASLNLESVLGSKADKYKALGEALAKNWANNK